MSTMSSVISGQWSHTVVGLGRSKIDLSDMSLAIDELAAGSYIETPGTSADDIDSRAADIRSAQRYQSRLLLERALATT